VKDAERARAVIPGGVNSGQRQIVGLEDLIVTATAGATFTDAHGRVYTDYHAAFGPPLLGHSDADVDRAVATAGRALGNLGVGVTPVEIRLAEKLTEVVPSVEKVLLTRTGSEATFHALRLARTATGRRYVVKFQGCYHGWHDSVAMNVISPVERIGQKDLLSAGILPEVAEATLAVPFNDAAAVGAGARRLRRQCRGHHLGADPSQHRGCPASTWLPPAPPRAGHPAWGRAHLRRGDHWLPARPGRLSRGCRREARPDDAG
jgi:glutamate-1-semialdehyde 2,1-aminomutase